MEGEWMEGGGVKGEWTKGEGSGCIVDARCGGLGGSGCRIKD